MKKALFIAACVCGFATYLPARTQNAQPGSAPTQQIAPVTNPNADKLTNADVIEMVGLGLSDDILLAKINSARATDFDTSLAGLKTLKAAKVSDEVIRAMINSPHPSPQPDANSVERTSGGQTMPLAQDQPAEKKQCLIVAPKPISKWEVRDSFNLKPENLKEYYKESDLTALLKQGVRVLKIDPAGFQLESAQATCKDFVK